MKEEKSLLDGIRLGESLLVLAVSGEDSTRLADLGFRSGARVGCVGISPLGDPIMLTVGGRVVAVRKRELRSVSVER